MAAAALLADGRRARAGARSRRGARRGHGCDRNGPDRRRARDEHARRQARRAACRGRVISDRALGVRPRELSSRTAHRSGRAAAGRGTRRRRRTDRGGSRWSRARPWIPVGLAAASERRQARRRQRHCCRHDHAAGGGRSVRGASLLGALAILGAAPAPLAHTVTRVYSGPEGLTVALRGNLLAYFGDATRPHAKWLSLARVLADPSSAGAVYIDVRLPERPAAGFPGVVRLDASSTETESTSGSDPSTAAELAAGLDAAVGGASSSGAGAGAGAGTGTSTGTGSSTGSGANGESSAGSEAAQSGSTPSKPARQVRGAVKRRAPRRRLKPAPWRRHLRRVRLPGAEPSPSGIRGNTNPQL